MRPSLISKPAVIVANANGSGEQLSSVPAPVAAPAPSGHVLIGGRVSTSVSSIFRMKTQRLDWRQIASVDIHSLFHSTSENELHALLVSQLLPQIAYCSIEDELLERDKLDPGFVKVFQIAQLLIEFLLHQHHVAFEAQQQLEAQCAKLGEEKEDQARLMAALREALSEARRVLRKRKKYLQVTVPAHNQNEGQSKGEYEKSPCPYCSKKFISRTFLHSHMLKRHQGIPADPTMAIPNITTAAAHIQQYQPHSVHFMPQNAEIGSDSARLRSRPMLARAPELVLVTMSTQTERDVEAVKADVEEFGKRLQVLQVGQENQGRAAPSETTNETGDLTAQMNRDITRLASRIQETGFEEFKQEFLNEIKKMKDMIISSAAKGTEIQETKGESNEVKEMETETTERSSSRQQQQSGIHVDSVQEFQERFLKQEKELETLRHSMQVKMQEDIVAFDGKLQAQERFWRMKLRQVEEQYEAQAAKLQEEVQGALAFSIANSQKIVQESHTMEEEGQGQGQAQVDTSPTPTPVQTSTPKKAAQESETKVLMVRPKTARPGNPASKPTELSPVPTTRPRTPQPVPRWNSLPKRRQAEVEIVHEYEDPLPHRPEGQDVETQVSDYQTTDSEPGEEFEDEDDHVHKNENEENAEEEELTGTSEEVDRDPNEADADAAAELRRLNLQLYDKKAELEQEKLHQRQIQAEVVKELGEKMKKLGLMSSSSVVPDGNENELEDVTKALVELKRRRTSEGNVEQREQLRTHVNFLAAAQSIENQFESQVQSGVVFRHSNLLAVPPPPPLPLSTPSKSKRPPANSNSNSPIMKMLSAVKQKGVGWKKLFKGKGTGDKTKATATGKTRKMPRPRTPTATKRLGISMSTSETHQPRLREHPHPHPFTEADADPEPSTGTFHEEMLQANKSRKAAKNSFFSRTKARFGRKSSKATAMQAESTESMRARRLRQDLQDVSEYEEEEEEKEEEEDGLGHGSRTRPAPALALLPLAVASPTRPKSAKAKTKERTPHAHYSHYSKPMKVKAVQEQGPRIFSASAPPPHLQVQTPQAVSVYASGSGVGLGVGAGSSMYPSEDPAQADSGSGWQSSGSESESEGTRNSERRRQLAKSLSDRKNNPETQTTAGAAGTGQAYYSHYQKRGSGAGTGSQSGQSQRERQLTVQRNLLHDFNTAEERWQGLYSKFQAQGGETGTGTGEDASEEDESRSNSKTGNSESGQSVDGDLVLRDHEHDKEAEDEDKSTSKPAEENSSTDLSEEPWSSTLKRLQMQK